MTAATSCRACGTELLASARFCHSCGAPSTQADAPAEYKHVTVLFADVVHSMDIAAAVGAERLREIMADLFNRSAAVVQRYGGTVDKFTGDGIMALFGAPQALEDHAVRACLAALDIQSVASALAVEVEQRDRLGLGLRVGLNSGEVIAGEIDSRAMAYTVFGEQVGMAQRMESAAPVGGVMVSDSTARLVADVAELGEPEKVRIKGSDIPVPARRLYGVAAHRRASRAEPTFVGRNWEVGALNGILNQAIKGRGSVVGVVGPAGIGKSRIVGETTALAARSGVQVFASYCDSHTSDVPFHAAAGVLRAVMEIADLDAASARARVHERLAGADAEDLSLMDDFLGIADPNSALPQIDPAARRRRLAAMVNAAALARVTPAVLVIEDVHWIDEVSESMIAGFLSVVPRTCWLVLVTYRPEYDGLLAHTSRSQTIALEPLDDSQIVELSSELLGDDPSIAALAATIAKRASGNPFFAEELVRDLIERGVLTGQRGAYVCADPISEVTVPGTLKAVIASRIDRLDPLAKRTLCAAAVIGLRFSSELLHALRIDAMLDDLLNAELVDQVTFTPRAEYAFRHPLIRAVAYESQLRSDRAQLHRQLADMIEREEQNAALIAEHFEAAGEMDAAYEWHMRAGAWSSFRDNPAARASWLRAKQVADQFPPDHPDLMAMRIAPRTLLCGTAFRTAAGTTDTGFEELRELCTAAGEKSSLAIGMAGVVAVDVVQNRIREASALASECMTLLESIGDPELRLAHSFSCVVAKLQRGEMEEVARWSQTIIDLAAGDPCKGSLILSSPLASALAWRAIGRWGLGQPGWREDIDRAVAMARGKDLSSQAVVFSFTYGLAIPRGVLLVSDEMLRELEQALHVAERSSDDITLVLLWFSLGVALFHTDGDNRARGLHELAELRDMLVRERYAVNLVASIDAYFARERAMRGDVDGAADQLRAIADELFNNEYYWPFEGATRLLVETLLDRGNANDLAEAQQAIERMESLPDHIDPVLREITALRLRVLLARGRGDETTYRDLVGRYRDMANSLGFEGHIAMAEAME